MTSTTKHISEEITKIVMQIEDLSKKSCQHREVMDIAEANFKSSPHYVRYLSSKDEYEKVSRELLKLSRLLENHIQDLGSPF